MATDEPKTGDKPKCQALWSNNTDIDFETNRSASFTIGSFPYTYYLVLSPVSAWTAALRFYRWTDSKCEPVDILSSFEIRDARGKRILPEKNEFRICWGETVTLMYDGTPTVRFTSHKTMSVLILNSSLT